MHVIARRFGLSADELAHVVRTLRQHDLIYEPVETFAAYQDVAPHLHAEASAPSSEHPSADAASDAASGARSLAQGATLSGDGAATAPEHAALHLPSLWAWLEEEAENAKDYVNTQAFILVEVGDALARLGVHDVTDLDEYERVDDPELVEAMERAVERNLQTSIPDHCYTA
jgi:hypothetical protein